MNISDNTTPKLTRIERIRIEAKKEAAHLAETFDLRECLHLERFGLEGSDINLTVVTPRGRGIEVELDSITEALQDFIRDKFAEKLVEEKIEEILNQESP